MNINGKDIGLRYTTGVSIWFQEHSKDFPDEAADMTATLLAVKMSEAYARVNGCEALTQDEVLDMEYDDFRVLCDEVAVKMGLDSKRTVETKEPKGKGKNAKSAGVKRG